MLRTPPTPPYMRGRIRRLKTSFKALRCRQDSSHWITLDATMVHHRSVAHSRLTVIRESSVIRTCSFPSGLRRPRGSNTMPSADFWSHELSYPSRPAFQAKLYSRVRFQISPDKGRDLSPPKCHIYLHSLFQFGFALACTLTWSYRPRMWFLYVAWRVLARCCRLLRRSSIAGFLPTVRRLPAVALTSVNFLRAIHLVR